MIKVPVSIRSDNQIMYLFMFRMEFHIFKILLHSTKTLFTTILQTIKCDIKLCSRLFWGLPFVQKKRLQIPTAIHKQ
jgi:hypothetical protein